MLSVGICSGRSPEAVDRNTIKGGNGMIRHDPLIPVMLSSNSTRLLSNGGSKTDS
jgi:hypothetical protein